MEPQSIYACIFVSLWPGLAVAAKAADYKITPTLWLHVYLYRVLFSHLFFEPDPTCVATSQW